MPREDELYKEKEVLEEIVDKPMGDDTIKEIFPKAKIIMYPDLKNYKNIDEILPHVKSYAIILYLNSPNSGHWTAIMKPKDNTYEFFDSYGGEIDKSLSWISKEENKNLGISAPYLTNLFKNSGGDVVWNKTPFQGKGGDISTCGRHACFRIQCMKNKNMSIGQYTKMMKNVKNKMNKNFDELVSIMISPEAD